MDGANSLNPTSLDTSPYGGFYINNQFNSYQLLHGLVRAPLNLFSLVTRRDNPCTRAISALISHLVV